MCKVCEKSEFFLRITDTVEYQRYKGENSQILISMTCFSHTIVVKKISSHRRAYDIMRAQNNPEYYIFQMKHLLPKSIHAGTSSTMSKSEIGPQNAVQITNCLLSIYMYQRKRYNNGSLYMKHSLSQCIQKAIGKLI
jgi:hypothetical protein